MKRKNYLALAGAIALLGMGFQACSSDDDATVQAPVLTGEVVKTQLAISIPQNTSQQTRMSEDATQADNLFNGIKNYYIYPLATANQVSGEYVATGGDMFIGLQLTGEDVIAATGTLGAANDYWINAQIPVGVNNMLFYGLATPTSTAVDGDKFADGSLTATLANGENTAQTVNSGIKFELEKIQSSLDISGLANNDKAQALLKLLNGVANASTTISEATYNWNDLSSYTYGSKATLAQMRDTLTHLSTASSESIRLLLEDLYNSLGIFKDDPMATAIKTAITAEYSNGSTTIQLEATTGTSTTLAWSTDPNFPVGLNLPAGAVGLTYNSTDNKFSFASQSADGLKIADINQYTYPAQLWYFANSPIRVANESKKNNITTGTTWSSFISSSYGDNKVVLATTQSIALTNQIQYGVANLETKVRIGSGVIKDSQDNTISLTGDNDTGLTWTGVLIGGQADVDWKFEPQAATAGKTIYDRVIAGNASGITVKTTSYSNPNYTLALQSQAAESNNDSRAVVTIALEFKNTSGHDFYGVNNQLISAGSTFYLLAKLDPYQDVTDQIEGTTNTGKRVFMQDFRTTAELTITSLAKAYNVVPDLRTPQLELGMSVNLDWQTGITFTQEIGNQ